MRMLRTNQSKNTWPLSIPARVNVSRITFFSSRSEKKSIFFIVDIVVKKQIDMCFMVVCTLIDNDHASLLFSQTFFSYFFSMKLFENEISV